LQRVSGHGDITGNKKADALAKKAPFYHINHNKHREVSECTVKAANKRNFRRISAHRLPIRKPQKP